MKPVCIFCNIEMVLEKYVKLKEAKKNKSKSKIK